MPALQRISLTFLLLITLAGCSSLPETVEHSQESVAPQTQSSLSLMSEQHFGDQLSNGRSAVTLQDTGWDALAQRVALVEMAEQSIDIQYYIWNSDESGHYLGSRLVAAADRGVKVRLMLDDINLDEREDLLTTLDSHPNIEIRIYNPIPTRTGMAKFVRVLGDFSRLNRRMHNKSFTVDGAFSVVGGRNIGDEYFDLADDINFRDRDALITGEVVPEIQTSFLMYWDSEWSYPVNMLGGSTQDYGKMNALSAPVYADYPALPQGEESAELFLGELLEKMTPVDADFVYDQPVPEDLSDTDTPKRTARALSELARESQQEMIWESAYLVMDDRQLEDMKALTNKGVHVKALTNSMASNDLITNHSAYAGRRQDMLESGMHLFELKPDSEVCEESTRDASKCAPHAAYGLHTKSAVFDRKVAGIGSFNFNLRSTYLNTESLLIIRDENLAQELAEEMEHAMDVNNSWSLSLEEGDVRWYSGDESWDTEPDTGQWDRFKSGFLQLFPIEKYL
ncbi:phospholipase D family protein [Vibrio agarivorans]|uniref:Phospholipase D family protein n=1 Tax=Vibrio agarivorans TaxID=153622 RepID=A0ABT7Y6H1_9VIBR|nr:phospholipase D family protein [Vibrio agarivorans]MDN2483600.1 phospholipase D family protein [Vibrio agarivorans]